MKMKKNLLKMALLAFATFAASVASAQSTYVLYGNVGEGEVKLSTTRDKASGGSMTVSDYIENDQVVGFTQTITGTGGWFMSFDLLGSEINPTILKNTEYNLVYDVRTSWSGDVKLKFEVQSANVHTEKSVSFDHDGEWHTITVPVQSWVDANVLQTIESSSRVIFGFVGGNWDVKEPTTIDYRNVKLVPVNVVPDTEVPTWVSEPTVVANSTSATISVNANDNVSTTLTYEVSKAADFATLETVNGKANETTEIALKGLSPETDYTYYVRVKDMAGNVGETKTVTFTTTAQAAVVATYYGVFYTNDWEEKATVNGKEVTPQINWKAETLEGYNDVIVTAELSEALPDGAALKFCAVIENVGQVDNKVMAATGKANEYTIKLSEVLPEGKTLAKDQIFGQFFFRLFPTGEGAFSRTKILPAVYKVGASNDPIATDTKAPEWGVDPVVEKVTDKTAEIVVNVTDDSGSAVITLTGDNGFAELKKEVKADGSNQTIALNGLTANTTYNLTLAIADAAGNAGESRTVNFTTLETPDREVLYHSFDFTSKNWTKHEHVGSNTFAPNGRLLLTVNADNTVTFKVTVDEGAETVDNAWVILHEIDSFMINAQEDGSFVGTSTKSISNREAPQAFHLNFVLKNGVGNSELDVMYFTPSEGSTSAVAEVETEAAKVVAANGVIRVEGDKTFAVYTVAGQLAFRGMGEVRLDKGVYVVVVDGKAQKVML